MKINKIIIWGHPLHSHTHSYIHNGFFIAFKELGYDTYWFHDNMNIDSSFDFSNSLVSRIFFISIRNVFSLTFPKMAS